MLRASLRPSPSLEEDPSMERGCVRMGRSSAWLRTCGLGQVFLTRCLHVLLARSAGQSLSQALRSYFDLLVVDTQKHCCLMEGAVQIQVNMVTTGAEAPSM